MGNPPQHPKEEWQEATADFKPGRYYDSMGFAHVEHMGNFGGDVFFIIWRFIDDPDQWYATMRYRYYAGPNTDPWTGGDEKRWYALKANEDDTPSSIRLKFETTTEFASMIMGSEAEPIDWIMLRADYDKAGEIMVNTERPWLHKKHMTEPNG
jgi:hypothetical protein